MGELIHFFTTGDNFWYLIIVLGIVIGGIIRLVEAFKD